MPEDLFEDRISRCELPIVFAVDTSGSMAGQRLSQLNIALQEINTILVSLANQSDVRLSIRLIEFNTTARWLVGNVESGVDNLNVYFSEASGLTNTGEALKLAGRVMNRRYLSCRTLRPVVFLITDGVSIDPQATIEAIDDLRNAFGGRDKILRVGLRIGDELITELKDFASVYGESPAVFDVDDLGHITKVGLLKKILFAHFHFNDGHTHDRVSPYDEPLPPDLSGWDDDGWDDDELDDDEWV